MKNIELAKIIVDALENSTLTSKQKEEVIAGILKSINDSLDIEKRYKLNNILDLFKEINIPTFKTTKPLGSGYMGDYIENYLGIFYKDNSFTIGIARGGEFISGPHPSYSKYTWSLDDISTDTTIAKGP